MSQEIEGYPLSPQQRRMWSLNEMRAFERARAVIHLSGNLDRKRLQDAWELVVARHEILRTRFVTLPGLSPLQVIGDSYRPELPFTDLSDLTPDAQREAMAGTVTDGPPAVDRDRPLELHLWQLERDSYALTVELSPLCADVRSMRNLFADELRAAYAGSVDSGDDPVQYADYAAFQEELVDSERESGGGYWQWGKLDSLPRAMLPFFTADSNAETAKRAIRPIEITAATAEGLARQARRCEVESSDVLLGCWQLLLQRWTGLDQFAIGAVFEGRQQPGTNRAIGLFARAVPLLWRGDSNKPLRTWLREVAATGRECFDNHETFVAPPQRSDTIDDPADWVIGFENTEWPSSYEVGGVRLSLTELHTPLERFAVTLRCFHREGAVRAELLYDGARIDDDASERMAAQFATALENLVELDPSKAVDLVDVVPQSERDLVVKAFNDTDVEFALDRCIHHHIEAQTERTPDAVAVITDDGSWTYRELDQRSNQWAHMLRQREVEGPIALMMKPSRELVAAILGTLKAGACYMPLDPTHPRDRLQSMLKTAGAAIAIADSEYESQLSQADVPALLWEQEGHVLDQASREKPAETTDSTALAYIMHTSGSTGQPKGVMVEHRGVCNHMLWASREIPLSTEDRVLQKAPLGFDASAFELFWPLFSGAAAVIARQDGYRDTEYMGQLIRDHRVTHIIGVPHLLRALLGDGLLAETNSLKCAVAAGEVLTTQLMEQFKAQLPDAELYNFYGPTEASIDVTYYRCPRSIPQSAVPIGRPFGNSQVYILDSQRRPVPIGVAGELYLGGVGLARGYVNRHDETAARFVANPFDATGESRLYRTGDVGRWMPDGVMEFLGRVDDQVKIRGYRIELEEIEKALDEHEGVRKSIVVVRGDDSVKRLVAFVIPSQYRRTLVEDIREAMYQKLPDYMVPSNFVVVDEFPLTANGKIDTNRLFESNQKTSTSSDEVVEPRSRLERVLLDIFREVLQKNQIGITENFFAMGGDSLLIIKACGEIKHRIGQEVEVKAFFVAPTVERLAGFLQEGQRA